MKSAASTAWESISAAAKSAWNGISGFFGGIWDADFEGLGQLAGYLEQVIVSGDRAADMAVRLKYAGIDPAHIRMERSYEQLVQWIEGQEKPVFIMPTYTAMLELRQVVIAHCGGDDFWK